MTKIKKILNYRREGKLHGTEFSYENDLTVRDHDGDLPGKFRTVVRDEDGGALYTSTERFSLDDGVLGYLADHLSSNNNSVPDVNPDSNLGGDAPLSDLRSISREAGPENRSYGTVEGQRVTAENTLWIDSNLYDGDKDWSISWRGTEPPSRYRNIIGEARTRTSIREREDWEQDLPDGMVEELPEEAYLLFRDMGVASVAEDQGIDPIELFESMYTGNLDHKHDYFVLIGGDSGTQDTMTLTDPSRRSLTESIEFFDPLSVRHLHNGREDIYFEDEIEELASADETDVRTISENREVPERSLLGFIDERFGLESVNGALTVSESADRMRNTIEDEVSMR